MPIQPYGVLRGRATSGTPERDDPNSPHYQLRVEANGQSFEVPINVKSSAGSGIGAQLLYLSNEQFAHPILAQLAELAPGFTELPKRPSSPALDYVRGNLFERTGMVPVPFDLPGEDNDLNDKLDHYVHKAIRTPEAETWVWGEGFAQGRGVHNVHMNQGNARTGRFGGDNGVYQDGGLMFHFPQENQWVAIFLAFQTQAWHTDDTTGHPSEAIDDLGPGPDPSEDEPDYRVRIIAALVNPRGADAGQETVTLINTTPDSIDLEGWTLVNRQRQAHALSGTLEAGGTRLITLSPTIPLGNRGGTITLRDDRGMKVHGVSYTAGQARREGETVVFQ